MFTLVFRLEFVTGRGGTGFHSLGSAVARGRGEIFGVIPAPHIPWTGPCFLPPIFNGGRLGNGRGGDQRQGVQKKTPPGGP